MTSKADFTEEEWEQVLEGPTSAGLMVAASERGGTFRESFSIAKAFSEARQEHGESELLDEVVSSKPKVDKTRAHSPEEMKEHGLQNLREALALVEQKASPEEVEDYKNFIVGLAERVAEAHKDVSASEAATVAEVAQTLGVEPAAPAG
jgi:hypothetical protein